MEIQLSNDYVVVRLDLAVAVGGGRLAWRRAMLLDWLIRHCNGEIFAMNVSAQAISEHSLGAMSRSAVLEDLRTLIAWGLVERERKGASWSYAVNHAAVVERFKKNREHLPSNDPVRSEVGLAALGRYLKSNSQLIQWPKSVN